MSVAILVYHRILRDEAAFHDVSEARFAAQLDLLSALGGVPDGPVLRLTDGRGIMLSFDDATEDHAAVADRLEQRGMRGVFLVPAGRIGEPGRLDASAVAALAARGHIFGAHGMSHRRFDRLAPDALAVELDGARRRLEELTQRPVELLAPPGGICPPGLVATARGHGYRTVRGLRWGYAEEPLDGLLPALPVVGRTSPAAFRALVEGRAPLWLGRAKDGVKRVLGEALWERVREWRG